MKKEKILIFDQKGDFEKWLRQDAIDKL